MPNGIVKFFPLFKRRSSPSLVSYCSFEKGEKRVIVRVYYAVVCNRSITVAEWMKIVVDAHQNVCGRVGVC